MGGASSSEMSVHVYECARHIISEQLASEFLKSIVPCVTCLLQETLVIYLVVLCSEA